MSTTAAASSDTLLRSAATERGGVGGNQAFALQYTALILIILTFVLGAFLRGPRTEPLSWPAVPTPPTLWVNIGAISYEDLFVVGQADAAPELAAALALFLSSHDVSAEIRVYREAGAAPLDSLALALARSQQLLQALLAKGAPVEALRVITVDREAAPVVEINFLRISADGI